MDFGVLSLLPVVVVIVLVFITRRTAFSLAAGGLVGAVMLWGKDFGPHWVEYLYGVLGSKLFIWVVLVCGIFGALVELFEKSGSIYGFNKLAERLCHTQRRAMLFTMVLSMVAFVDEWLSILTAGNVMKKMTDRLGITRERLTLLLGSTAISFCVLIPYSTWGVFMVSQLVAGGVCTESQGVATFIKALPFIVYPWITLLFGLAIALDFVPLFGPIKSAVPLTAASDDMTEAKARQKEEKVLLDDVEKEDEVQGKEKASLEEADAIQVETVTNNQSRREGNALNLIIPIIVMTVIAVISGEILYGAMICLLVCAIMYLPQKLMKPGEFLDCTFNGFKGMLGVFVLIVWAFMLRDINTAMKMPEYVIGLASKTVSPEFLPILAFLLITFLAVASGNFWGICAIAFPVFIPIAQAIGADVLLTAGAIISGTTAGAHFSFFGSEITVLCATTQIDNLRYAKTCIPMMIIPLSLTTVIYIILGVII